MMEMQGVAVLNSILRPHLSLDPDGAARVQQGAIQPSRVVPEESKTDHNVLACGDPNSEAKSACIRRMQARLEVWDQDLCQIVQKKQKDDQLLSVELRRANDTVSDLSNHLAAEQQQRAKAESERDSLMAELTESELQLASYKEKLFHAETQVGQYMHAYGEADARRSELEEEVSTKRELLAQNETLRRRLHEQVTDLQGQLAIEEQRSRFCTML